jgi:hypothetical protein
MSAFDTLERQLRDAAQRRPKPRLVWRLAPAVALAAAVLAFFMLARDRAPIGADEREAPTVQPAPTWTPILAATIDRSPVPPEQAQTFAILRRPQSDADRSPAVQKLLKSVNSQTISGVRVDAVRLLAERSGRVAILLPIRRLLDPRGHAHDWRDPLCLVEGDQHGSGMTCAKSVDALRGRLRWPIPPRGLAPDPAASVSIRVRGGKTVAVDVRNNYYDAHWVGANSAVGIAIPRFFDARDHELTFR